MNKIRYYLNVAVLPLVFLLFLMANFYKFAMAAIERSVDDTKFTYQSNKAYFSKLDNKK